ncbi:MAG: low-specificity L-threonine aldolase [Woeseia sp.]|nr:low-specificity L-threonine aldolase [Woeseia sp.]MBT6210722.1 low-specificity L-threonine aldolase [Woeseia sp.]
MDLRSDTVTRPTPAMRQAMADAVVGDDVYGDDPTVIQLQKIAAEMLGTEAALFMPSGTQSNLCALLSHCQRGDEYIVGQSAHTYLYEGGGAAVLGSIQPQPLDFLPDGSLDLEQVAACIKPDDPHFAKTKLLCLENTQGGKVLPLEHLAKARALVDDYELQLHLDGARIFNASVKLQVPITEISRHFDSISICLSKGLCAPMGSLLCGSGELIERARRWRKMLGGGMRQVGIVAAAGILALTEQVQHLQHDHANARLLALALNEIPELDAAPEKVQTNMVFVRVIKGSREDLVRKLTEKHILVSGSRDTLRLVTHYDIKRADVEHIATAFSEVITAA